VTRRTTTITVRNLPPAVVRAVKEKARTESLSLSQAVIKLLEGVLRREKGAPGEPVIHHDLDHLAGTWSEAEYQQFMQALHEQRRISPEMWK
jgi:hypothetical protein